MQFLATFFFLYNLTQVEYRKGDTDYVKKIITKKVINFQLIFRNSYFSENFIESVLMLDSAKIT